MVAQVDYYKSKRKGSQTIATNLTSKKATKRE
jgi:hypothetical protein